jgi:hypothetical protein
MTLRHKTRIATFLTEQRDPAGEMLIDVHTTLAMAQQIYVEDGRASKSKRADSSFAHKA